jgi:hypothetical protein
MTFTEKHRDELLTRAYANYTKLLGVTEEGTPNPEELLQNHFGVACLATIMTLQELQVMAPEDIAVKGKFSFTEEKKTWMTSEHIVPTSLPKEFLQDIGDLPKDEPEGDSSIQSQDGHFSA